MEVGGALLARSLGFFCIIYNLQLVEVGNEVGLKGYEKVKLFSLFHYSHLS